MQGGATHHAENGKPHGNHAQILERDNFSSRRHPAPAFWWSMTLSEDRYPPLEIML
jgi:hypothetical protein